MRIKLTKSCSLLRCFEPFLPGESSWFEYLLTFNKLSFIWHKVTKCEEPSKARTDSFGNCLLVCWAYFLNLLRRGVLFWIFSDAKKEGAVISQREVTATFSFLLSANMTNVFFVFFCPQWCNIISFYSTYKIYVAWQIWKKIKWKISF